MGHGDVAYRPYAVVQEWRLVEARGQRFTRSVHHSLDIARRRARESRDASTWLWDNWAPWFVWHVIDRRSGEVLHTYQ